MFTGQHYIINCKILHVLSMSFVAPIALLTILGKLDPPFCVSSQDFFLND